MVAAAGNNSAVLSAHTIGLKEDNHPVTVSSDPRAQLMHYLKSVCYVLNFHRNGIDRFTDYANYAALSVADEETLVGWCKMFNPEILKDRVFFEVDNGALGSYGNYFCERSEARAMIAAAATTL